LNAIKRKLRSSLNPSTVKKLFYFTYEWSCSAGYIAGKAVDMWYFGTKKP
jgi:hypothetical protein